MMRSRFRHVLPALTVALVVAMTGMLSAQNADLALFKARADVAARLDVARQSLTDPEARAEMSLHWAEALNRAGHAVPFAAEPRPEPYRTWLAANSKYLIYDEPGGQWILSRSTILELHRMFAKTQAADDIAWLLVRVGLAGECEGYLPCVVTAMDLRYGEYLRLHSGGRYDDDARQALRQWIQAVLRDEPSYRRQFVPADQCGDLKAPAAALRAAVSRGGAGREDAVVRGLDELLGWCRK